MSHTKGPWETTDQINVGGDRPLKAGATRIGSICRTGVSREEADANARLIIAAPDLLAACLKLQKQGGLCWCATWREQGNEGECPDCVTRAAITKATGEEFS